MKQWLLLLVSALLLCATAVYAGPVRKTTVRLSGEEVKVGETNLGNFVADALREASGADMAIVHAMAFRDNALIPEGVVDEQMFRNVLALPTDKVSTLKLKPAVLRAVLQRAFSRYPAPNQAFLQVSGIEIVFDSANPPATRIVEVRIGGKPVDFADDKTTYTVAMPHQLAKGAVGYLLDFTAETQKTLEATDTTLLDAVMQECDRERGVISPKVEERLVDKSAKTKP